MYLANILLMLMYVKQPFLFKRHVILETVGKTNSLIFRPLNFKNAIKAVFSFLSKFR